MMPLQRKIGEHEDNTDTWKKTIRRLRGQMDEDSIRELEILEEEFGERSTASQSTKQNVTLSACPPNIHALPPCSRYPKSCASEETVGCRALQ